MMTLSHLAFRIKRSCLRIYGEVVNKECSSQFSRNCKLMTPSNRDRVLSAAEDLCAAISKPHQESFLLRATEKLSQGSQDSLRGVTNPFRKSLGTNDLFQESQKYYSLREAYDFFRESQNSLRGAYKLNLFRESQNSLRGANNLFQESQTSLREACYLFRESQNSLRGTNSKLFWEAYKSNNGSKISRLRETTARVNAFQTTLRDSECNDIIYTDYKTYLKRVDSCEPKIPHCVKNHRHSRLPYFPVYNAHPIFQDNFPKIK